MSIHTNTTKTLTARPGDLTALDVKTFLIGLADDVKVRVRTDYPDRPGEVGTVTLTAVIEGEATA